MYQQLIQMTSVDLIKILLESPNAEITFNYGDVNLAVSTTEEKIYCEVINKEGDIQWFTEEDFNKDNESYAPTGKQKKVIHLDGDSEYIPNLKDLKETERIEIEKRNIELDSKLGDVKDQIFSDVFVDGGLTLALRIHLLLTKLGLGDSGRGYSPFEIKGIFSDKGINYSESIIREAIFKLESENKIKRTGKTKNLKFCITELYDEALKASSDQ